MKFFFCNRMTVRTCKFHSYFLYFTSKFDKIEIHHCFFFINLLFILDTLGI